MARDVEVFERPDWWQPGMLLPHLYPSKTYTGTGMIGHGGRVFTTGNPVAWESYEAWQVRKAQEADSGA
jgi:hypothetical protein